MNPLPWSGSWNAWRLDREVFKGTWDSGIGAQMVGGRWNPPGRHVVYASADPATAILEVAVHAGFDTLDTVPHVLTCFEVLDPTLIYVVQPEDVPNPLWLSSAPASPNQQTFADALLAEHPFVLIPSAVSKHSWNLLVSCDLAAGKYRLISQERFGLDTRLVAKP
ncbi:RES family NAD+ phosphorylase [Pseudomonas aeruginosa]|uniref:RES family NAD+ phosphorylase n=1 Tax=Pseudomonadaceae TaxID=135621 RepID=UPI0008388794|nr:MULTISPECIES: RES family NAD+ phosphorylase [unclassified Pseudomonas]QIH07356.1 RES family NAD+ phosphorylase [Pseudomonas sp. BIOMIG1BAC]HBP4949340.1 RES family NAD+ phosphorylase [Pseudomonas aeruginosa]